MLLSDLQSRAVGAAHFVTASQSVSAILARSNVSAERPAVEFRLLRLSALVALGHDEQSLALHGVAGRGRAEYSCRNAVAHCFQWRDEGSELAVSVPRHVFAEDTIRPALVHDAQHLVDEEPIVGGSLSLSSDAVGLARVSASDAMNDATPRSSVEGGKVRPDRRGSQFTRLHARCQKRGGCGFPLHVSDAARSVSGKLGGEFDAEPEATSAGAEFDDVEGT